MSLSVKKIALAPLLLAMGMSGAYAQSITVGSASGLPGATVEVTVNFAAGASPVGGYDLFLTYDHTILSAAPTCVTGSSTATGFTSCSVDAGTHEITMTAANNVAQPNHVVGKISFPIAAGATPGTYPLTHAITSGFSDPVTADPVSGTFADGAVVVTAAPPDVVLGYAPASAVAFPGGTQGDVTTANIAVSVASGTVGTGTLNNCVITGPNAGAFSVTAPGSVTAPPAANLGLSVTLSNAALAATLTCDVADAGTPVSHTWSLTAPAGTPVPGPALTATPAAGSTATQSGLPGATLTYNFGLANSGFGSGAGTTLDYNCSVSGAGFTLASGATGSGIAVGASGTVVVTAVAPADGTSINGSLDCTSNAPGFATFSFPLVATGRAFVAPTFVPASSLWSKIALFGLLGALGMLTFGLRRNH